MDIKVAILGNSGVGKTCIITRYVKEIFKNNFASTIGVNSVEKIIKRGNDKYILNIWDTAGQEKYKSLSKHFYRDAYIIVLIYDITNQNSFDSLKEQWFPEVQTYAENCVVLGIVGNKADLYDNEKVVNEDDARDFASEIGAVFSLVSAKSGLNISIFFENLLNKFLEDDVQKKVNDIEKRRRSSSFFDINSPYKKKIKKCC